MWQLVAPGYLSGCRVHCDEQAIIVGARGRAAKSRSEGVHFRGNGGVRPWRISSGLQVGEKGPRAVGAGRPFGTAFLRWLDQRRLFLRHTKNGTGPNTGRRGCDGLWDQRIDCRNRLCGPRLLPCWFDWHWRLRDREERGSVPPVKDIVIAGLIGVTDRWNLLAVALQREQVRRLGRVIIPNVVVNFLKMPAPLPGGRIERHNRRCEQVFPGALRSV